MKLKDPTKLGKLDVENEILRIMKLKPKLDREIERNAEDLVVFFGMYLCITVFFTTANGSALTKSHFAHYFESLDRMKKTNWPVHIHKYLMDSIRKHVMSPLKVNGCMVYLLYWFSEHNNSMTPSNEQGFPRFLRWVISDISNTIDKDINESMKKMQPEWVKACSDEQQKILDEYRKNRQENSTDALKRKLYISLQQRDEALEELSDLQVKHENLVSFIEEKGKNIHAADPRNVENDKDLVDLFVDTLQEIISFNKELKREDERDDDEQEEEECEKGDDDDDDDDEEGEKCGDLHDDSDDDE
ncbi:transcription termination factor 4, mitochondrial-like [Papaver somniferum]|uniref:transcription termination factor 4, mitochondrial-like n=1 Tax=Papaver somniferum TaxID=3469 RepID=UPI000E6FEF4C|nr:transcription termination factor 4, mitochondrial-like [Papaver somniferum]